MTYEEMKAKKEKLEKDLAELIMVCLQPWES